MDPKYSLRESSTSLRSEEKLLLIRDKTDTFFDQGKTRPQEPFEIKLTTSMVSFP